MKRISESYSLDVDRGIIFVEIIYISTWKFSAYLWNIVLVLVAKDEYKTI